MAAAKIARIAIENFTVFGSTSIEFSPTLNVIVGENGAGKSHLLKILYSVAVTGRGDLRHERTSDQPRKLALQTDLAAKLVGVFRPWSLGRLVRRVQGSSRSAIKIEYTNEQQDISFEFGNRSKSDVIINRGPESWTDMTPVFFPTRELLTIYPGFVSLWEGSIVPFEETWRDTCVSLGRPLARGPRLAGIKQLLEPIEAALGGRIVLDGDEFYLKSPGIGNIESSLLAEGLRKFGMLAQLIANGTLLKSGVLFWDEPEANLNPKALRDVAKVVVALSEAGVQVFMATHSLFLMREISMILEHDSPINANFIGLHQTEDAGVVAQVGSSIDDIGDIAALDEALAQTDRYLKLA